MITIKVNYENGDYMTTRINCNFEEAKKYYEGNIFNIGAVEDNLQKCTGIELLSK